MADRYQRICKTHRRPVVETPRGKLRCGGPRGHEVVSWDVLDRQKALVMAEASAEHGWVKDKKEVAMSQEPKKREKRCLRVAKFKNRQGAVLFIRVLRSTAKSGDP